MAFTSHDTPAEFFGAGYSHGSNAISLKTATFTGTTVGTTFQGEADDNVITTAGAHTLIIGDRVRVTQGTTLPTGLAASTDYYVLTTPTTAKLTLGASRLATTPVVLGSDGTADNTIQLMGVLDEVTDAEADEAGDARKVIYGVLEMLVSRYNAIPAADRPTKLVLTRQTYEDTTTGEYVKTYNVVIRTNASGFEVAAE